MLYMPTMDPTAAISARGKDESIVMKGWPDNFALSKDQNYRYNVCFDRGTHVLADLSALQLLRKESPR